MDKKITAGLKRIPWSTIGLVGLLILLDLSIHPLTGGPDRMIHDPAVYRLNNPSYMPNDWYTKMAVDSGVYIFYSKLIHLHRFLRLPEELWRYFLYLSSLAVLYYSLVKIARLFSKNLFVVPMLVLFHAMISTGANQPVWLYGPFAQIDGGVAPRSIGTAASFLALLFLLRGSLITASFILGVATLIHVSNSLIVYTLYLLAWLTHLLWTTRPPTKEVWLKHVKQAAIASLVYLCAGGWYAFYAASISPPLPADFGTEKFIWVWVYLRAPYMALPLVGKYWWIRLVAHTLAIAGGWILLRPRVSSNLHGPLAILSIAGLGSIVYFFIFYLFAFVWPWLPGFQFYSIRVLYVGYFVAYLFMSLVFLTMAKELLTAMATKLQVKKLGVINTVTLGAAILFLLAFSYALGDTFRKPSSQNLRTSWFRLLDTHPSTQHWVPDNQKQQPTSYATLRYLLTHPEPVLAPPDTKTPTYLPNIVSFKSFGFTTEGLPQWYNRLNDVTQGRIETIYKSQQAVGENRAIELQWKELYQHLTTEDVLQLAGRYNFRLFLASISSNYPFPVIVEDHDYRLYQLPSQEVR
jgi:hypothetical protein